MTEDSTLHEGYPKLSRQQDRAIDPETAEALEISAATVSRGRATGQARLRRKVGEAWT